METLAKSALPGLYNYDKGEKVIEQRLFGSTNALHMKIYESLINDYAIPIPERNISLYELKQGGSIVEGWEWKFAIVVEEENQTMLAPTFYVNWSGKVKFQIVFLENHGKTEIVKTKEDIAKEGYKNLSRATDQWMTTKHLTGLMEELANYIKSYLESR